jgi:hypothetical protein
VAASKQASQPERKHALAVTLGPPVSTGMMCRTPTPLCSSSVTG